MWLEAKLKWEEVVRPLKTGLMIGMLNEGGSRVSLSKEIDV